MDKSKLAKILIGLDIDPKELSQALKSIEKWFEGYSAAAEYMHLSSEFRSLSSFIEKLDKSLESMSQDRKNRNKPFTPYHLASKIKNILRSKRVTETENYEEFLDRRNNASLLLLLAATVERANR